MDVAAATIAYLDEATTATWYHDVPSGATGTFGTLTRSGGPMSDYVRDQPTLTLQCHADTRGAAADLAEETKAALMAMPYECTNVFACEILGDYYDPLDGQARHRVTCRLTTND